MKKTRIMWIEFKGEELSGPARIGRVSYSKSGRSLYYGGKQFKALSRKGYKCNYVDKDSGDQYWISGCRRDGMDALYNTDVEVDGDVRREYWLAIRRMPEKVDVSSFRAVGKY
jgi:hypothetical protein